MEVLVPTNAVKTKQKSRKDMDIPAQHQKRQPGRESEMEPAPLVEDLGQLGSDKLRGKCALITGGDSGIGRAVAVAFAREGADVAIVYLEEDRDAEDTKRMVERHGRKCILIRGDIGDEQFCRDAVGRTARELGGLQILVNNAAEQHPQDTIENISEEQLVRTFRTNVFSFFFMSKAAVEKMADGGAIINTTSVTAYRGSPELLDYSATKDAIVAFTRSLSKALVDKGIRVNAVAPGPVWTPLIPASFDADEVDHFGEDVPMHRPGQPDEIAPSFVFLASQDSTYMSGQVLHPNGGEIVNG
jgi:NAD(P)-dependent dehydrogenase (short-subunit alcohol dehydrogenase family)